MLRLLPSDRTVQAAGLEGPPNGTVGCIAWMADGADQLRKKIKQRAHVPMIKRRSPNEKRLNAKASNEHVNPLFFERFSDNADARSDRECSTWPTLREASDFASADASTTEFAIRRWVSCRRAGTD